MADKQQQSIHPGAPTVRRIVELEKKCASLEREKAAIAGALRRSACPAPFGWDNGTVGGCVGRGHCCCENASALAKGGKHG